MDQFSAELKNSAMSTAAAVELVLSPPTDIVNRVEIVSDLEALRAIRRSWNRLVEEAGIDHPFLGHEWICSWWECFGSGKELYILLVKTGARLQAIAPLMFSRESMHGVRVRRLGALYNPHTPRLDFIVAPGAADGAYHSIWRHVLDVSGRWDVLEIPQMLAGSPTLASLSKMAADDGFRFGVWHGEDSPYVPFRGTWESYVKQLSHNHRTKLRKGLNRLSRLGEVRMEVVSAEQGMAAALDDGLRIEAAAWKAKTGTAVCSQPDVESFYKVYAEHAAANGSLRLLFLTVAGTRIAFAYALYYRDRLFVLKAGYDPAYARYSPYNLLCHFVFKDGFERALHEYEFLGNNEPWKLDWTREVKPHYWLQVFGPRPRARLLHHAKFHWIPILRRQRLYLWLRDALFVRRRRGHGPSRPVPRGTDVDDGE